MVHKVVFLFLQFGFSGVNDCLKRFFVSRNEIEINDPQSPSLFFALRKYLLSKQL